MILSIGGTYFRRFLVLTSPDALWAFVGWAMSGSASGDGSMFDQEGFVFWMPSDGSSSASCMVRIG
ncbi:hypothetical protein D7Y23_16080 [Corallococcus sp. AB050B]|nr:hypothetical protein D7Y23_16080 [Corallococcus sp. AB050B]